MYQIKTLNKQEYSSNLILGIDELNTIKLDGGILPNYIYYIDTNMFLKQEIGNFSDFEKIKDNNIDFSVEVTDKNLKDEDYFLILFNQLLILEIINIYIFEKKTSFTGEKSRFKILIGKNEIDKSLITKLTDAYVNIHKKRDSFCHYIHYHYTKITLNTDDINNLDYNKLTYDEIIKILLKYYQVYRLRLLWIMNCDKGYNSVEDKSGHFYQIVKDEYIIKKLKQVFYIKQAETLTNVKNVVDVNSNQLNMELNDKITEFNNKNDLDRQKIINSISINYYGSSPNVKRKLPSKFSNLTILNSDNTLSSSSSSLSSSSLSSSSLSSSSLSSSSLTLSSIKNNNDAYLNDNYMLYLLNKNITKENITNYTISKIVSEETIKNIIRHNKIDDLDLCPLVDFINIKNDKNYADPNAQLKLDVIFIIYSQIYTIRRIIQRLKVSEKIKEQLKEILTNFESKKIPYFNIFNDVLNNTEIFNGVMHDKIDDNNIIEKYQIYNLYYRFFIYMLDDNSVLKIKEHTKLTSKRIKLIKYANEIRDKMEYIENNYFNKELMLTDYEPVSNDTNISNLQQLKHVYKDYTGVLIKNKLINSDLLNLKEVLNPEESSKRLKS